MSFIPIAHNMKPEKNIFLCLINQLFTFFFLFAIAIVEKNSSGKEAEKGRNFFCYSYTIKSSLF